MEIAERFYSKVVPDGDCLVWSKATHPDGYGVFQIATGKSAYAHRVAWFLEHGEWPLGVLRHTCDNPPCVKLGHLRDGTQAQNVHDAIERGRAVPPPICRGERNHFSRLTETDVGEVRTLLAEGVPRMAIARRFGVSRNTVARIDKGQTWVHVGVEPGGHQH